MKTIAVIGGSNKGTLEKLAEKHGYKVLFHHGKVRGGGVSKEFRKLVKKADCVVVLVGACGHITMDLVKDLCKETNTPIRFQRGFGASGAIQQGIEALSA